MIESKTHSEIGSRRWGVGVKRIFNPPFNSNPCRDGWVGWRLWGGWVLVGWFEEFMIGLTLWLWVWQYCEFETISMIRFWYINILIIKLFYEIQDYDIKLITRFRLLSYLYIRKISSVKVVQTYNLHYKVIMIGFDWYGSSQY